MQSRISSLTLAKPSSNLTSDPGEALLSVLAQLASYAVCNPLTLAKPSSLTLAKPSCLAKPSRGWQSGPGPALRQTVPRAISAHARKITDVEYLPEERVLTCSEDGSIKLWNLSETEVCVRMDLPASAKTVEFAPDNTQIAVPCGDGRIWLGRADDAREVDSVPIGEQSLQQIAFYPDGSKIVVGDDRGKISAWDRNERRVVAEWSTPQSARIWGLAVGRKGGYVASAAADQLLRIHDAESLSAVETISAPANVIALDFSPDGRSLAYGGDFNELFLCESGTWARRQRIPTRSECLCIAFANKSNLLASGHTNGFIQIMDASKGSLICQRLVEWASQVPGLVAR